MANQEVAEAEKQKRPSGIANAIEPVREYFRDTLGELRKVHWPTRLEARNLTLVVLATLIVASLILGLMDFLFERLILSVIDLNLVGIAIMAVIAIAIAILVVFSSRSRNRY
jgi:preprotein translocase subunit SecE